MALTTNQLFYARREISARVFGLSPATATKPQIDAVATAATTWLESNATSFATALNGTVAAGQPAAVLAAILASVAEARYGGVA